MTVYEGQKLLIANRGEIAVRIIRTAKQLSLRTIAIYTPSDASSPHVSLADEAVALPLPDNASGESEAKAYLSPASILSICQEHHVTLVHPGYGFLSENAEFASLLSNAGITWLGPKAEIIKIMGMKHEARKVAVKAGLSVVPGSDGLVETVEYALKVARDIGFPVILKATAGGGGMGMVICRNEIELREKVSETQDRAEILFGNNGVFLERYFPKARHIEIQVFGNGEGDVVHMAERECSVQRRHQKVIEESPSPFFEDHPGLRERMSQGAVELCRLINYASAGTIEFIVDNKTGGFYFLEINTRIQVEHPITEATHPGLDLVRLMIQQGISERKYGYGLKPESEEMQQATYNALRVGGGSIYSIEGRIYAENPVEQFVPSPGLLQLVDLPSERHDWLRIESWVATGITITPFFDPLLCKIIVRGSSREEAVHRFKQALDECKILGPPNNARYLKAITESEVFRAGQATTQFLDSFNYTPCALKILSTGIDSSIQDLPGRTIGLGIPRSGPMDSLAFSAANILVGNSPATEGLEIVVVPGVAFCTQFFVPTVVCVTGKDVLVKVDDQLVEMWSRIRIPAGGKLKLDAKPAGENITGFRVYVAVLGGFPDVPSYLGSKSTSMGLGGYQGRSLLPGDQLSLRDCEPKLDEENQIIALPRSLVPTYPSHWVIHVLSGPHDDEEFLTSEGITKFYNTRWRVSASSNRLGIRLESSEKFEWANITGGEGGSHPSNILDNGYAPGTINVNGDTPVILTREGPDMGGYVCLCTVASAEMWKLGQLSPGSSVEFRRVSWSATIQQNEVVSTWLAVVHEIASTFSFSGNLDGNILYRTDEDDISQKPVLYRKAQDAIGAESESQVVFKQAGDSAILVEFGTMTLDLSKRAHIHAFEAKVKETSIQGILSFCPCIRSILIHFDPFLISQADLLRELVKSENSVPDSLSTMEFPGRRLTFPIVLDDSWNREALERYMRSSRNKAVYLPSNIEYLARNNGLIGGSEEALRKLIGSDWLVLGVGFYLACPFLVPIDPRCRLVGQKMNPSRTFTPRGAIGIAGPVSAIYPIESPGGYQLFGRTLPGWQTWGNGPNFHPDRPWLLQAFDQVHFEPVTEEEYIKLEKQFDAGEYSFKIESTTFSMADHAVFLDSIQEDLDEFRVRQKEGSINEEKRERELLMEWEAEKLTQQDSGNSEVQETHDGGATVTASIFASVWKIKCRIDDVITSPDDLLLILEAMKTEIPVRAGEDNVGKTVKGFGKGIKEQAVVRPGDVLVVLD
ncbi:allophanate hydrolase subunit 2-domain-containing protein [Crucibulum laeve]|uniref:Allophanate hydrolase subunit 2-domain-containing protein n=1 Tax=Crucibulum laeve TaxID=68775 RepID=A0A5C3LRE0_9AGAR|nr:allophanate hydrolase subunit 2-domain-containing protein [Crucibulum laeve]